MPETGATGNPITPLRRDWIANHVRAFNRSICIGVSLAVGVGIIIAFIIVSSI